jgi:flagellar protein FliO/FliZ
MDTVALVGRLLVSLAVVLGLMWVVARRVKRPGKSRNGRLIDVLSRQQLSRTSSVTVVRVMDQALILGVTDGQINVLGETDLAAAQEKVEAEAAARPARPARTRTVIAPGEAGAAGVPTGSSGQNRALTGSVLSGRTWRQAVEALRDLTARTR